MRFVAVAVPAAVFLFAFWSIDTVLVRTLFSDRSSGLYAVAAVLGRIPFLSATGVVNFCSQKLCAEVSPARSAIVRFFGTL
jgi:O-antigen/teichoic acid export membrane protein